MSAYKVLTVLLVAAVANEAKDKDFSDVHDLMSSRNSEISTSLQEGTVLGLQRSMHLSSIKTEFLDEEDEIQLDVQHRTDGSIIRSAQVPNTLQDGSILGLQRSMQLTRGKSLPLEELDEHASPPKQDSSKMEMGLANKGSLLGLQLSVQLTRDGASLEEDITIPRQEPEDGITSIAESAASKAASTGLQQSTKLTRTQGDILEDLIFDEGTLELSDVSVLGLQRSMRLSKTTMDVGAGGKSRATDAAYIPGLQSSMKLSRTTDVVEETVLVVEV